MPIRRGILTLQCSDRSGIVAAVATALSELSLNITEASQFNDSGDGLFFMRAAFETVGGPDLSQRAFEDRFASVAAEFRLTWKLTSAEARPRVLIGVSRFGHCLFDLMHRWRAGVLPVDVVGVFSNHDDMRSFVEWNGVAYHHLPVDRTSKPEQEARLQRLIDASDVDLVVLARYMQILSPDLCAMLYGRCINIHHSFLPSFTGAKPYHQAHVRGVKIIGATAHYVTADLDEGPIIEQAVERVDHGCTPADMVEIGRDIEARVLARAVKWHIERRVMLSGRRTVVFS